MECSAKYAMLLTMAVLIGLAATLSEVPAYDLIEEDTDLPSSQWESIEAADTPSPSPSPASSPSPVSSPGPGRIHAPRSPSPAPAPAPAPLSSPRSHRPRRPLSDPSPLDFCSRAVATKSCPTPHTSREFDVEGYLGRWYEIGATAQYKFMYEPGLICDHVMHSLLVRSHDEYGAIFALLNRGQPVIKPFQAAEVARLSVAARDVCNNAHAICKIVAPHALFTGALHKLNATINIIRNDSVMRSRHELANLIPSYRQLRSLARNITAVTNQLARDMTRLQYLNSDISQGLGHQDVNADTLLEVSSAIKDYTSVLNLRISEVGPNIKTELLREAAFLKPESVPLSIALSDAIVAVYVGLQKVQARLVDITALISGVTNSARAYDRVAPPYKWNPLQYPVSEARGVAVQNPDSAAKFVLHQHGFRAPYWVLDVGVDIGTDVTVNGTDVVGNGTLYDSALIYSCTETKEGPPLKQLFILSRNVTLADDTLSRFAATAADYGIYTDAECDNPFIYAVQDPETCSSWPF